jgi:hypothetical protein
MGFIVFGIIMAVVLVIALAWWASQDCGWYNFIAAFMAVLLGIATGVTIICFCFTVWSWNASEYKANIVNREYGTEYTREEIFYGSDVIETIRELDRKRLEINGNIMRDKE